MMPKAVFQCIFSFLAVVTLSSVIYAHPGHIEDNEAVSGLWHVLSGADHIFLFVLTGMAAALFLSSEKTVGLVFAGALVVAAFWAQRHLNFIDIVYRVEEFEVQFVLGSVALWALGYFGAKAMLANIAEAEEKQNAKKEQHNASSK